MSYRSRQNERLPPSRDELAEIVAPFDASLFGDRRCSHARLLAGQPGMRTIEDVLDALLPESVEPFFNDVYLQMAAAEAQVERNEQENGDRRRALVCRLCGVRQGDARREFTAAEFEAGVPAALGFRAYSWDGRPDPYSRTTFRRTPCPKSTVKYARHQWRPQRWAAPKPTA